MRIDPELDDLAKHHRSLQECADAEGKNVKVLQQERLQHVSEVIKEAKDLNVTKLINAGNFEQIHLLEVRKLFRILDKDGDGRLDAEELGMFFSEVMQPPCSGAALDHMRDLIQQQAADEHAKIGPEYFHSFLTLGPLKRLLHDAERVEAITKMEEERSATLHLRESVPREFLINRLQWRTSRDESFRTLPFILVYFVTFLSLVIGHLRWWDRQMLEKAAVDHMAGWGYEYIGPYLEQNAENLDNVYTWLQKSGLQFAFGYCHKDADKTVPAAFCEIAPRNMLIGDILLRQKRTDSDDTRERWLLHQPVAQVHLKQNPDMRYEAALKAMQELRDVEKWTDANTEAVELTFSSYNQDAQMFAVSEILIRFDSYGLGTHSPYTWAIPATAYPHWWPFVCDGIYIILLLIPFKKEVMEVCTTIRSQGLCTGLQACTGFWNCIDWFLILNGCALIQTWLQLCWSIEADSVQSLLEFPDYTLKTSAADNSVLTADRLKTVLEDLKQTRFLFRILHILMALNMVAIMWKFAKSFQSNARLQVVQRTLQIALSDVAHFMVVFMSIFTAYAIIGHILFGNDLMHFNSFGASFNTVFLCLTGDFGYYSDLTEEVEPLGSGLPYFVYAAWFWTFEIFTVLVMMNMLLAIVMDNYSAVTTEMSHTIDAPSIILQTRRFFRRRKQFKSNKWIPLETMLEKLEDKNPVHPEKTITHASLVKAFEMSHDQADFIMKWMLTDLQDTDEVAEVDTMTHLLSRLEAAITIVSSNVHVAHLAITHLQKNCDLLEDTCRTEAARKFASEPAAEPANDVAPDLTRQLESQASELSELCSQFANEQTRSETLQKTLDEVRSVLIRGL